MADQGVSRRQFVGGVAAGLLAPALPKVGKAGVLTPEMVAQASVMGSRRDVTCRSTSRQHLLKVVLLTGSGYVPLSHGAALSVSDRLCEASARTHVQIADSHLTQMLFNHLRKRYPDHSWELGAQENVGGKRTNVLVARPRWYAEVRT